MSAMSVVFLALRTHRVECGCDGTSIQVLFRAGVSRRLTAPMQIKALRPALASSVVWSLVKLCSVLAVQSMR